jgi:hypothetical protein
VELRNVARRPRQTRTATPAARGTQLDEAFIDSLYREEKICPSRVRWKHVHTSKLVFEVNIFGINSGQKMIFRGVYQRSLKGRRFRFSITIFRNIEVRRYCASKHHKERHTNKWIREPHKHRFVSPEHPNAAYKIPKGEIHETDVNQAFIDFLKECNIKMTAPYEQIIPGTI